jgi:glycine cleavage system H protein
VADIPKDMLYTEEHEYVKPTGDAGVVAIGVTDYAQGELGDVVFVELPKVGTKLGKHDVFGTVEAVKAVSELYSPLSGEVVEINERLDKEPALVNTSPYDDGWMIKLRLSAEGEKDALLGPDEYAAQVGGLSAEHLTSRVREARVVSTVPAEIPPGKVDPLVAARPSGRQPPPYPSATASAYASVGTQEHTRLRSP